MLCSTNYDDLIKNLKWVARFKEKSLIFNKWGVLISNCYKLSKTCVIFKNGSILYIHFKLYNIMSQDKSYYYLVRKIFIICNYNL